MSLARPLLIVVVLAAALAALPGCGGKPAAGDAEYMTIAADPRRDTDTARRHNGRAVELLAEDRFEEAEKELKAALVADLFFGPAHNNLGTVYFRTDRHYLAAWEFQYAAKLMPERSQPRTNLGLVFEAVGKLDDAAKWYDAALELAPESTEATANLARVRVRQGLKDSRTRELLEAVVMKDGRQEWKTWARRQLALMPGGSVRPSNDALTP